MPLPSQNRGKCGQCRHANHGTDDASEGLWACPWLGATGPEINCRIIYRRTGLPVFEPYNESNCTWGTGDPFYRAIPAGFEEQEVVVLSHE